MPGFAPATSQPFWEKENQLVKDFGHKWVKVEKNGVKWWKALNSGELVV